VGQKWDNTRTARRRWAGQLQQLGRITLASAAAMFIACLAMRWLLTDTGLLAVASRALPTQAGAVDRETLNAGNATQILDMFTVALPALMILLITAGALHRSPR